MSVERDWLSQPFPKQYCKANQVVFRTSAFPSRTYTALKAASCINISRMSLCQPTLGRFPSILQACLRLRAKSCVQLPAMLLRQQQRQQKRSCQSRRQGTLYACPVSAYSATPSQPFRTECSLLQADPSCVELEAVQVTPDLSLLKVGPLLRCLRDCSYLLPAKAN